MEQFITCFTCKNYEHIVKCMEENDDIYNINCSVCACKDCECKDFDIKRNVEYKPKYESI